ncbi:fumarylacetoacetate hydrolase family protein [Georgenia yuyongxinii]|uniref:Fumarylacetoacetate hydrolase family protein n=1 Tax=Georgenia yuyongxinii TaxID=2589797 RepID=A0A552WUV8_9MICO|nr:fumarylacetoacetate hydrolase family protein [Georgenia yuyongxinii]TRW46572.1 fumarylacetoacetate hydrolase family protein [Georgenia yuyongxinii]
MRFASVRTGDGVRIGVVDAGAGTVTVLPADAGTLDDVVRGGAPALEAVAARVASGDVRPLAEADLAAPLARFNRDVLCTGWNYWDHFEESKGKREGQEPEGRPLHPTFFTKGPQAVVGPYDDIAFDPELSAKWDYEAEVAIVIGKDGRSIPEDRAMEHVFGFALANDVSQRDLQRAHGGQWLKGKSIDGSMPFGPWLTTPDDVADPYGIQLSCELNGQVLQDASTAQVAFRFERIIAELSRGMTLRAGDVILTGTPAGIGNAREPQIFLGEGDVVVTAGSGLGQLRNTVRTADLTSYVTSDVASRV